MDGPDKQASSVLWVNSLRVGIRRGFEAELALPVAWMEAKDAAGTAKRTSVGDVPTRIVWNAARRAWSYGLSGGVYWPVGELGTEGLPATATFSTGTVDPTAGAHLRGPELFGFGWQLSSSARLVVADQDDGSRLGSSFTTTAALDRPLGRRFVAQALLTHFHRQADRDNMMEDSGGDWLYLQPQLLANLLARRDRSIQAYFGARIPLRQNVRGMQLVESTALSFGLALTREF